MIQNINPHDQDSINSDFDELVCNEHGLAKKYYVPIQNKFYCEHDNLDDAYYLHFRSILDKYSQDIKNLKNLSSNNITKEDYNSNNNNKLNKINEKTNFHFKNIFSVTEKFGETLKNFGNSFISKFNKLSNQDNQIFKLKDLIDNIKFNSEGRADYVGIGANAEREKNYLQLAQLLISRNSKDIMSNELNLANSLQEFIDELQKFLIKIVGDSNLLLKFSSEELLKELYRLENKKYDNNQENKFSDVFVLKEEINKLNEEQEKYKNLCKELVLKISNLEEKIKMDLNSNKEIQESLEKKINILKIEIDEINSNKSILDIKLQDEKKKNDNFQNLVNQNNAVIENYKKIIKDLKDEIDLMKMKESDQLVSASSRVTEISKAKTLQDETIHDLENKILKYKKLQTDEKENYEKLLNEEKEKYEKLRSQLKETTEKLLNEEKEKYKKLQTDEKGNYEKLLNGEKEKYEKLKLQEKETTEKLQKLLNEEKEKYEKFHSQEKETTEKLQKLNQEEKEKTDQQKIQYLNTIENNRRIISELTKEGNNLKEKINNQNDSIENLSIHKINSEKYENNIQELKIQLHNQLNQNEILNTRIEELENNINNLNKENSDKNSLVLNSQNYYNKQIDEILMNKEFIEKEIIEEKSKNQKLTLQLDDINIKYDNLGIELNSIKDQNKILLGLQNKLNNLTSQLEEMNEKSSKLEIENSELKNKLSRNFYDLEQFKNKIEQDNLLIIKLKEEIKQGKFFEKKIDLVANSRIELDKLKTKIENDKFNSLKKSSSQKFYNSMIGTLTNNINNTPIDESFSEKKISKKLNFNGSVDLTSDQVNNNLNNSKDIFLNNGQNLLLTKKHANLIKDWFNTKNFGNIGKFTINLIMKATRDGFEASVFKTKCHKKPSTLVVVLTSFDKLIGGYTPYSWNTGDFTYITDELNKSFLFSLTNEKKYNLKNPGYSICHGSDIGPIFGGGSDLEIVNNCNKKYNHFSGIGHTYDYTGTEEGFYGGKKFLVKDYEVYEVKFS